MNSKIIQLSLIAALGYCSYLPAPGLFRVNDKPGSYHIASKFSGTDLPTPWKQRDIGGVARGRSNFKGGQFIIEGSGNYDDSSADRCHYTYVELESEGELTIRVLPEPGSQFSEIALMMRESLSAGSIQASLMLYPGIKASGEAPNWRAVLLARSQPGRALIIKNRSEVLAPPILTDGRLTGNYWLRLQRKFNSFYAFTSNDGKSWISLGSTFVEMKKKFYAGIAVSSGSKDSNTTVLIDHVSIPGWSSEN